MVSSSRLSIAYDGGEAIFVLADRDKISMVLTNLINNAQKYSPDGGKIVIFCKIVLDKICVGIKDEGIGISISDQQSLFQKFNRIRSEKTRLIPGFGIRLYLVSNILKMHESEISVESDLGKGATFTFYLHPANDKHLSGVKR